MTNISLADLFFGLKKTMQNKSKAPKPNEAPDKTIPVYCWLKQRRL
jgi:hypothetical protein